MKSPRLLLPPPSLAAFALVLAFSASALAQTPADSASAPGPTPVTDSSVPQVPGDPAPAAVPVPPPAPPLPKFGLPAKPASVVEQDFIGHRYNEPEDTGGWGWVKLPEESWKKAHWVTLRETPGIAVAPWRTGGKRDSDQDYEYRLHGYFAPYRVYDPHTDEMLEVLIIDSVTPIEGASPAKPLDRTPGPDERKPHSVRSSFRSREF
ncbi:hypothetical protein SAMN05444156_2530 [Verrucomicrobium sp. GAS474]|uniref:hypothetical protein n=1 Tax=Verrucomicrobium sp. GAS474 TaxID=1882831 RepID=UPI000879CCE4|nr:hypothetical protein [Verrucomicrobium sp. GAS474]SDU19483.1 hypothetical protein SAMN05444156_2530 [Verrucomicrobium sp. GAS474]